MKRVIVCFLILILCISQAGCGASGNVSPAAISAPETKPELLVTEATSVSTEPPAEETTVPPTEHPRVPGPDRIEGSSVIIGNVSVEYLDELPKSITKSSTYDVCGFQDEFVLNDSQIYALIHFSVTNQTAQEIKIADIHDEFLVELIYDDQFVYTPNSDSWCFFEAGAQVAVVSDMAGIGSVKLAPLVTKEVTVYIPCARQVSAEPDKHLDVVFTSNYAGYENLEFVIR